MQFYVCYTDEKGYQQKSCATHESLIGGKGQFRLLWKVGQGNGLHCMCCHFLLKLMHLASRMNHRGRIRLDIFTVMLYKQSLWATMVMHTTVIRLS
jgi:hypothetical protein